MIAQNNEVEESIPEQSALQASVSDESHQIAGKEASKQTDHPMSYMDFLTNPLRTDHPFGK